MAEIPLEIDRDACDNLDAARYGNQELLERIVANGHFDRVHRNDLTYNEFFRKYLRPNIPVIVTGIATEWECSNWARLRADTTNNNNCDINFDYLKQQIGADVRVPVANCHREYFNSHEKLELGFHEYIDYWTRRVDAADRAEHLLYLKDWHLSREVPAYNYYRTPVYFGSDWLNEYCVEKGIDDYRFVYMGPKGTWTPYHVDVFSSFSWSTNIAGTKKWVFTLPNAELKLKDHLGNLPFSINESLLNEKDVQFIEIIQKAGETVFVPSGWYHQVWNMADTISVNHNWFNACNVLTIWTEMESTYRNVIKEIADCCDMDDFEGHCQLMLNSVFGMNFEKFFEMLDIVASNRVRVLQSSDDHCRVNDVLLGKAHATFDLQMVSTVLKDIDDKLPNDCVWLVKCRNLLEEIRLCSNL